MTATQTQQIKVTSSTDLFQSLPTDFQNELWETCPFSFGDCSFSLVHPSWVKSWILDIHDVEDELNPVNQLLIHLDELSKGQVYIDLES
jgi:hypothetical protein